MNQPTRRQFLRDCSLAATAAALAPAAALAQTRPGPTRFAERLRFEHFAAQLNTAFCLGTGPQPLRLVLVNAARLAPTLPNAGDARNERFCLCFRGPAREPLAQDTYLFQHARLGRLAIFVVPEPGFEGAPYCQYTAIFNFPLHPADVAAQLSRAPQAA